MNYPQLRIHDDGPRVCEVDALEEEAEKFTEHVDLDGSQKFGGHVGLDEVSVGSDKFFDHSDLDKSELEELMRDKLRQHQRGHNDYVPQVDAGGDVMPDIVDSSSDDNEPGTTEDRSSRDLEKRALCKRGRVLRRVLRIEQSRELEASFHPRGGRPPITDDAR